MRKIQFINLLADTFSSSKVINLLIFILFTVIMTATLGASLLTEQANATLLRPKQSRLLILLKPSKIKKKLLKK